MAWHFLQQPDEQIQVRVVRRPGGAVRPPVPPLDVVVGVHRSLKVCPGCWRAAAAGYPRVFDVAQQLHQVFCGRCGGTSGLQLVEGRLYVRRGEIR